MTAIILEAVGNKQAELKKKEQEEDVETNTTVDSVVVDEVENA